MGALRAVRAPAPAAYAELRRWWDAGDAVVLVDPHAPDRAVARLLTAMRPASLTDVGSRGQRDTRRLDDAEPVADDVALVVATSGSTGAPKGVELSHAALTASTRASLTRLAAEPGDRWALALPTHHVAGVAVHLRAAASGTEVLDASASSTLATVEAEHISLVPTQLVRLLDEGVDVARFRTILLGGAAASDELLRRARGAGARIVLSYGMSETCGGCVYDGVPLDGVEVQVSEGRIRLRGPVRFTRYRRDDDATRAVLDDPGGWFVTGDLGRFVDGRLVVDGRADDVAISGGENVPLAAVTRLLLDDPAVRDAVVTARSDPRWGQQIVAVVVADDVTLARIRSLVREQAPAAWAPQELIVVDALPRDAMGKLSADRLADLVERGPRTGGTRARPAGASGAGASGPRDSRDHRSA